MTPIERVLGALDSHDCRPRSSGKGWCARCPAHDDREPSLSISEGDDGRVLLACHAGCDVSQVAASLGVNLSALFPSANGDRRGSRILATYDYRDEMGELLFQVVRSEPKAFKQRRPDRHGGWIWSLDGVRRVLYRLPELVEAIEAGRWIFIVEGEKAADRLAAEGLAATCSPGGAGKWRSDYTRFFAEAHVVVLADNDVAGRTHALTIASHLHGQVQSLKLIELPELPEKGDVVDWLEVGSRSEELMEFVLKAPKWSDFPPLCGKHGEDSGEDAGLLDVLLDRFQRYVVFPSAEAAHAVVLWVAATHAQAVWQHATRLILKSPMKRCGKSRLLDLIDATCHSPLMSVNVSAAAVFRSIDPADPVTLLIDEADSIFAKKQSESTEDLRGLLNAGFQRNRPVLRCVGPRQTPTQFPSFAMAALAAIGDVIPDTITDRGVTVTMQRRAASEQVHSYRLRRDQEPLRTLGVRLGEWVGAHLDTLADAEPALPVDDRAADAWEPLVAIGDLAGGKWPVRARAAAWAFTAAAEASAAEESTSVRLLSDLHQILEALNRPEVSSERLVRDLRAREESPWERFALTQNGLARRLKPYGIHSTRVRPEGRDGAQARGYRVEDFTSTFERYLASTSVTASPAHISPVTPVVVVTPSGVTTQPAVTAARSNCDAVTVGDGPGPTDDREDLGAWCNQTDDAAAASFSEL
jgi:hypothetical protein